MLSWSHTSVNVSVSHSVFAGYTCAVNLLAKYSWSSLTDILSASPYAGYRRGLDGDTAVKTLIGINLAGWLLWQTNPTFMKQNTMVSYESLSNLRLHTLLTSAFSHYDGWHLFTNMFALYFFGRDIGRLFGGRRACSCFCKVLSEMIGAMIAIGAALENKLPRS